MFAQAYLSKWQQVPKAVKLFLLKALVILVLWKLVYLCFLAPGRVLDAPLTYSVGALTVSALNGSTGSKDYTSKNEVRDFKTATDSGTVSEEAILFKGNTIVFIEDACNGLELFVLYIGFIWILPATTKRRIWYTVAGVSAIYAVNVFRCAMVTYMTIYYPAHADFAHHYVFAFIVYAFIIALWLGYSNKVSFADAEK